MIWQQNRPTHFIKRRASLKFLMFIFHLNLIKIVGNFLHHKALCLVMKPQERHTIPCGDRHSLTRYRTLDTWWLAGAVTKYKPSYILILNSQIEDLRSYLATIQFHYLSRSPTLHWTIIFSGYKKTVAKYSTTKWFSFNFHYVHYKFARKLSPHLAIHRLEQFLDLLSLCIRSVSDYINYSLLISTWRKKSKSAIHGK